MAQMPDSERKPAHPPKARRRRRTMRRLVLGATLVVGGLVVTQAVVAAPPSASIGGPATATRGQSVGFTSSVTDADPGQTFTYAWDFGDGGTSTAENPSHTYATLGQKTVTLTVTDSGAPAEATTVTHNVNVVNVPPVAAISFAAGPEGAGACGPPGQNPLIPLVGQQVGFSSNGSSDPDNAADGNPLALTFAWDLDVDGPFNTDAATAAANRAYPNAGNKTVELRVTDSDNATDSETVNFRVNTIPVPSFISDDPTPIVNQQITFASTSDDPDFRVSGVSESLSYAWDIDGDGFDDGTTANITRSFPTAGTKTVRLCVRDTGGIARMATKQVLIQNTVPNGAFTFSPDAPVPGQAVAFNSTSTPSAGRTITGYEWDFDWNGDTFTPDASGASVSRSFSSAGPKSVALKVTESGGGFDIVVRSVNVNAPPQASFGVAPSSVLVDDEVTLASTSSDPDGPLIKQEWDLDNDGQFDDANAAVVSARFRKKGTYTLRLRVTDSKGATAVASQPLTVRSRPLKLFSGVVIGIKGRLSGVYTEVRRLLVRAPKGSKISVRCRGKNCPKRVAKKAKGLKKIRFKTVERKFRPGTKLIVTVTKSGFLTKQTSFTIRRGREPRRQDLCLRPGAKTAKRCPSG